MAKQIILYNLKDSVTEEDYLKWCETFKGPFLLGLDGSKSFTLVRMVGGMKGDGQKMTVPELTGPPYKYIGILDLDSLAHMDKARQDPKFKDEFFAKWYSDWVADFYTLGGEDIYHGTK